MRIPVEIPFFSKPTVHFRSVFANPEGFPRKDYEISSAQKKSTTGKNQLVDLSVCVISSLQLRYMLTRIIPATCFTIQSGQPPVRKFRNAKGKFRVRPDR